MAKYKFDQSPKFKNRRRAAAFLATVAAAGAGLGARETISSVVSNANAPNGRAIPRHIVTLDNVGGHRYGAMSVEQGNTPAQVDLEGAEVVDFMFSSSGNSGLKALTDTYVPDQDISEAVKAAATYLPEEDQANKTVYPGEQLEVVINNGRIIPKDQLPEGYLENHEGTHIADAAGPVSKIDPE